jgi:hypothetical protein
MAQVNDTKVSVEELMAPDEDDESEDGNADTSADKPEK